MGRPKRPVRVHRRKPRSPHAIHLREQQQNLFRRELSATALQARDSLRQPPKPSVVITGAALGLPGTERIFDDANIGRILQGEQFIDVIPRSFRRAMLDKHITRLVKSESGGAFETIDRLEDVIKLAGRGGAFDVESEFGVSAERSAASTALPLWRLLPESMRCATPAFLSSCVTRRRAKVRSCRIAGNCRRLCATTPA